MRWKLLLFMISLISVISANDIAVEQNYREEGTVYIDHQMIKEEQKEYVTNKEGALWISNTLINDSKEAKISIDYEGTIEDAQLTQVEDGYVFILKEGVSNITAVLNGTQFQWIIYVDHTPPLAHVFINDQEIEQDAVFYTDAKLSIHIEEEYLDRKHSYIKLNDCELPFTEEDGSLVMDSILNEPGRYDLHIYLQDISGSIYEQQYLLIREFEEIYPTVIFDGHQISDQNIQKYYGRDITVQILLDQVQFQEEDITILDQDIEVPIIWKHEGSHHQASFVITQDGFHQLLIRSKRNEDHEPLLSAAFYIDKNTPEAQLHGLPPDPYSKHSVTITLKGHDAYLNEEASFLEIRYNGESKKYYFKPLSTLEIQKHLEQEGRYEIFYHLEDYAGNIEESETVSVFMIDKTSPNLWMSDENQEELLFYNEDHSLQFSVEETYPDVEQMKVNIKKDGVQIPFLYDWRRNGQGYDVSVSCTEEGIYEVFMEAADLAGNKSRYPSEGEIRFVIDKTKPTVGLYGIDHDSYHNQDVEIIVQAEDSYISTYSIEAYCNNEPILLDGFHMTGSQNINEKGIVKKVGKEIPEVFEIRITAIDQAGNTASSEMLHFTIDKKPPSVMLSINGKRQESGKQEVFSKEAELTISSFDELQSAQIIRILKNGELILDETQAVQQKDIRFQTTLTQEKQRDDVYQVEVTANDVSGNQKEEVFSFRMDSYLPDIMIANDVFQNKPYRFSWIPALVFEQVEFQVKECTLLRNHEIVPYEWGDEIIEEGAYQLYVLIEDEAGNRKSMKEPFSFVIDKTAPDILIIRKDEKTRLNRYFEGDKLKASIILNGELQDSFTSVSIDGKMQNIENIAHDDADRSYIDIDIQEEGYHEIIVEAQDTAGNASYRTLHCLIAPPLYFKNRIRILAGSVIAMISCISLLRKLWKT